MKISEMTNDQAAEALVLITPAVSNICDDTEATEILQKITDKPDTNILRVIGQQLPAIVAFLLKKHKVDLYEIIAGLTFSNPRDMGKMNFLETVKVVRESYDDVLASFFTQSAGAMKANGG